MDGKIYVVALVAYCLMIISYTLGFMEKYTVVTGFLITSVVVFVILIVNKYIIATKERYSREESDCDCQSEIGMNLKGKKILFEDIDQLSDSRNKIIGNHVEGDEITFRKIRQ